MTPYQLSFLLPGERCMVDRLELRAEPAVIDTATLLGLYERLASARQQVKEEREKHAAMARIAGHRARGARRHGVLRQAMEEMAESIARDIEEDRLHIPGAGA